MLLPISSQPDNTVRYTFVMEICDVQNLKCQIWNKGLYRYVERALTGDTYYA